MVTKPVYIAYDYFSYMDKRIAHNLAPNLRDWGADMVTLHVSHFWNAKCLTFSIFMFFNYYREGLENNVTLNWQIGIT